MPAAIAMGLVLAVAGSCGDRGDGARAVNMPPETFIVSEPNPDEPVPFAVRIFWYGTDEDGRVDHFLVTAIKGASQWDFPPGFDWDSLDGWTATASRESTFRLIADSCCIETGNVVSAVSTWGVLVRAVDNEGGVSTVPAAIFFRASNVLPRVKITVPQRLPIAYLSVPPHPFIAWEGVDPDGEIEELQYKYIVLPESDVGETYPRLPPFDQVWPNAAPGSHAAAPIGYWSHWVSADCTYIWDLDLSMYKGTEELVMAYVTARDEADGVLPEHLFGAYNNWNNSIRMLVSEAGTGVNCVIDGGPLGRRNSFSDYQYRTAAVSVFQGMEFSFRFWGEEDKRSGALAEAFKYYWDSPDVPASGWNFWTSTRPIRVEGAKPEWTVRFPFDGSSLRPATGDHVMVVRLVDRNQVESECHFPVEVLAGPAEATEQKILLVDDNESHWPEERWLHFSEAQDSMWADILAGYNWEEFDTGPTYDKSVPPRFIGDATTVIWLVDDDNTTIPPTQLLSCCTERGNYLHSYVRVGGNLIIIGKNAVFACGYWPDVYPDPRRRGYYTYWNFDPAGRPTAPDTTNFMWDVFGIAKMRVHSGMGIPYTALWPCDDCCGLFPGIIELGPEADNIYGVIENTVYITDLRGDADIRPLCSTAIRGRDGEWEHSERGEAPNYIAVYVPGNERRGHAAYLGFPEFWFDHEKIKSAIRRLLDEFGEQISQ